MDHGRFPAIRFFRAFFPPVFFLLPFFFPVRFLPLKLAGAPFPKERNFFADPFTAPRLFHRGGLPAEQPPLSKRKRSSQGRVPHCAKRVQDTDHRARAHPFPSSIPSPKEVFRAALAAGIF